MFIDVPTSQLLTYTYPKKKENMSGIPNSYRCTKPLTASYYVPRSKIVKNNRN